MASTYSLDEIKKMIPSLDLTGIEALKKLLLNEKELFQRQEIKTLFALLDARIIWIKNNRAEWTSELCGN
jgi:hypothetical protein